MLVSILTRVAVKVLVIESNDSEDFYDGRLDGVLTAELLKLMHAKPKLRYALDLKHFKKSVTEASQNKYDVIHVSCHGNDDGIVLANNARLNWNDFVDCFQQGDGCPSALVMSSCCGATAGIGEAFARADKRPDIIFGSTDSRHFDEYAVAWALLYKEFSEGVTQDAAQIALKKICAAVHKQFRYRRWSEQDAKYKVYPGNQRRFEITEIETN
jgi:hypothetical protein